MTITNALNSVIKMEKLLSSLFIIWMDNYVAKIGKTWLKKSGKGDFRNSLVPFYRFSTKLLLLHLGFSWNTVSPQSLKTGLVEECRICKHPKLSEAWHVKDWKIDISLQSKIYVEFDDCALF